jgi:hypothetical protein
MQNHHKHKKLRTPKKKIGLFYKIILSVALIVLMTLSYFVILVSAEPKSIPFVTEKIEISLKEKFGDDAELKSSKVSFTRYGTLKVEVSNLKIFYTSVGIAEKQTFVIPKLESEFSLLNLLLMRFHPSKIKIINPEILLSDLRNLQEGDTQEIAAKDQLDLIMGFLSSVRNEEIPIKNLEVENAKLLIRDASNADKISKEILIKKSKIRVSIKDKTLHISAINTVNFDAKEDDVDFNSSCQVEARGNLKCDLVLANFAAHSISNFHPSLSQLNQIDAAFDATTSFSFKDGELDNLLFKAEARKGSFDFPDFFGQRMEFNDLRVSGEYDNKLGVLDLSDIKVDFASNLPSQQNGDPDAHMAMSLLISDFNNPLNKKLDFYIKLQNARNDELEKFWPVSLHEHGIRAWVIEHVKGGMIRNAYAKFSLQKNQLGTNLNSMNSEIIFSGINLNYDEGFPAVTNASGIASFTKDVMKISISSGDVLNSKISEGLVVIDDFHAPVTTLKISGKSQGHAADGLRHVDHKSQFAVEVDKYLNGDSQNTFDIQIPLRETIDLKDVYIAVNSKISNLQTDYAKGEVSINLKKDSGSYNFITNVDLTAAELTAKAFDITKNSNVQSGLDLIIFVKDPKKILLKNISLWKKEEVKVVDKNSLAAKKKNLTQKPELTKIITSKINADAEFETSPFLLTAVNVKNNDFGNNNYEIAYKADAKTSTQKIFVKGQQLNFAPLIEEKFFRKKNENHFANSYAQISLNNVSLLRGKSFKSFYAALSCGNDLCYSGLIKASYGKKQFLNLRVSKKAKENFSTIDGRVSDVGYFAEAVGISNVVSAGDAKIKATEKIVANKKVLEGEIEIDNDITIFESATVKRLTKNNLFSQVRDTIFSSEKTTFNSVKLQFDIQDEIINIKSLIANNYKIGITAKGVLDVANDTYEIKGMIVPGFIINNLFGIGKIPLIGGVISGLLTGGEGGGLFGIHYEYVKKKGQAEPTFETNKVAAFVPSTIQNLFD